jgi:hypothetical protein
MHVNSMKVPLAGRLSNVGKVTFPRFIIMNKVEVLFLLIPSSHVNTMRWGPNHGIGQLEISHSYYGVQDLHL